MPTGVYTSASVYAPAFVLKHMRMGACMVVRWHVIHVRL